MPSQHAKLSPSKSHLWLDKCPGSVNLQANVPRKSSPYAREGTGAHAFSESVLLETCDIDGIEGKSVDVEGQTITCSRDMVDYLRVYVDYVQHKQQSLLAASLAVEQRSEIIPGLLWGTADAVIAQPFGLLEVIDLKYGSGKAVDVYDNPQLKIYALGVLGSNAMDHTDVTITIVQPRADHRDGVIRSHQFGVNEILAWKHNVLMPAAERAQRADAPRCAGPWCKNEFCNARAICPEYAAMANEVAQNMFSPVAAERPQNLPAPSELNHDQLLAVLSKGDLVKDWITEVFAYAQHKAEHGEGVPGFKLVAGRSVRKFTEQAVPVLLQQLGDAIYENKMRGVTAIEKLLKNAGWKAKDAKEFLATVTEKSTPKRTLVPDADPRKAINPVTEMFETS